MPTDGIVPATTGKATVCSVEGIGIRSSELHGEVRSDEVDARGIKEQIEPSGELDSQQEGKSESHQIGDLEPQGAMKRQRDLEPQDDNELWRLGQVPAAHRPAAAASSL